MMSLQLNQKISPSPNHSANTNKRGGKKKRERKKKIYSYFNEPQRASIPDYRLPKTLALIFSKNLTPWYGMTMEEREILDSINNLKHMQSNDLIESNYLQILKLLLYMEEYKNNLEMRRFDMNNKKVENFENVKNHYKIETGPLEEGVGPSIRPFDMIELRDQNNCLYVLQVQNVLNDAVIATATERFAKNYSTSKNYNIRFRLPNYPFRCSHYALSLTSLYQLTHLLFPIKKISFSPEFSERSWFNDDIESNIEQKQAILNILNKSSKPAPYIVYGPPGTGKTATIVEAICQVFQDDPSNRILICTPSNSAADVITKRLLTYIPENKIYRMYSPSRKCSSVDDEILACSNFVNGEVLMLPKEVVIMKHIVITTLCAATRLLFLNLKAKHFSYLFIDEAGQATEPDTLIPYNLMSGLDTDEKGKIFGQVVISGDPKQLGPGVRSKIAEPVLGTSLLERLMSREPYMKNEDGNYNSNFITKLIRNYRSHSKIIQVSNELFYENELLACGDDNIKKAESWEGLPKQNFPVFFHGVVGTEEKEDRSPSPYNLEEVKIVTSYVSELINKKMGSNIIEEKDIGIVTPFLAQKNKIKMSLCDKNLSNIEVGTVELFQGQEKEIIIISSVRSKLFKHDDKTHIGFLSNPKRFNVALTRAKALLIVVGNPYILKTDEYWCYLLKFCYQNKSCVGLPFEINNEKNDDIQKGPIEFTKRTSTKHITLKKDSFRFIQLDDGIQESSTNSLKDEEEFYCPRSKSSPIILSDFVNNKFSSLQLNKSTRSSRSTINN